MWFCRILYKLSRLDIDTVVGLKCQWPEELWREMLPAVVAVCNYFEAMTDEALMKEMLNWCTGRWCGESGTFP